MDDNIDALKVPPFPAELVGEVVECADGEGALDKVDSKEKDFRAVPLEDEQPLRERVNELEGETEGEGESERDASGL